MDIMPPDIISSCIQSDAEHPFRLRGPVVMEGVTILFSLIRAYYTMECLHKILFVFVLNCLVSTVNLGDIR